MARQSKTDTKQQSQSSSARILNGKSHFYLVYENKMASFYSDAVSKRKSTIYLSQYGTTSILILRTDIFTVF